MSFATRLAQIGVSLRFVADIEGIDGAFVDFDVPSGWQPSAGKMRLPKPSGLGTEVYTVYRRLDVPDLEGVVSKLSPKGGNPTPGTFKISLMREGASSGRPSSDPIRNLFMTTLDRSDATDSEGFVAYMDTDLPADQAAGVIGVIDDPWAASSGSKTLFVGRETIVASRNTNPLSIGAILTRAAFGSQKHNHWAVDDGAAGAIPNGLPISDRPLSFGGRAVRLHCIPGYLDIDDNFIPYGADDLDGVSGAAGEHSQILLGIIQDVDRSDPHRITLICKTAHVRFKEPLVQRYPQAQLTGPSRGFGSTPYVWVDSHNWWLKFAYYMDPPQHFARIKFNNSLISDGDTITVTGLRVATFTAKTTPTGANHFAIGGSSSATKTNFINAANAGGVVDTSADKFSTWYTAVAHSDETDIAVVWQSNAAGAGADTTISTTGNGITTSGGDDLAGFDSFQSIKVRLKNPDSPATDWVAGLRSVDEIIRSIQTTINEYLPSKTQIAVGTIRPSTYDPPLDIESSHCLIPLNWVTNDLGGTATDVGSPITRAALNNKTTWVFYGEATGDETIIRYLGFEDLQHSSETVDQDVGYAIQGYLASPDPVPLIRWPSRHFSIPTRVYLDKDVPGWDWDNWIYTHQYVDDDGNTIDRACVIEGVDAFTITAKSTDTDGRKYLLTGARLGSFADPEEPFSFAQDGSGDPPIIRVVPWWQNTSVARIALYMLLGGTGVNVGNTDYDKGPPAAGLYLRQDMVDVASFEEAARRLPQERDNWMILPGDTFEVFGDEWVLLQEFIVLDNTGRLALLLLEPPLESEIIIPQGRPVRALTALNTRIESRHDFEHESRESWIVNGVETQWDWRNATKEFVAKNPITVSRRESQALHNPSKPIKLKFRGARGAGAQTTIRDGSTRLLDRYYLGYDVLRIRNVATREALAWSNGELATLTHALAPKLTEGGLGLTDQPCRIVDFRPKYKPRGRGGSGPDAYADLTLITSAKGLRRTGWAPSATLSHDSGAIWDVDAHGYSDADDPDDITWFLQGFGVYVSPIGDFSQVKVTTISSVSATQITLASATAWTDDSVIWWLDYDHASLDPRQRAWIAHADSTCKLEDDTGATAQAFSLL